MYFDCISDDKIKVFQALRTKILPAMAPFQTSKRKVRCRTEIHLGIDQLYNMRYHAVTLIQEDSKEGVHFS